MIAPDTTPSDFPYTGIIRRAYEIAVGLNLGNHCHLVSSKIARNGNDAGVEVEIVYGYFIPMDDISLCARTCTPLSGADYVGNYHWWLRFPKEGYSVDLTHRQVDPENPLLIVRTFLEPSNGLFFRSYVKPLLINRKLEELDGIWSVRR